MNYQASAFAITVLLANPAVAVVMSDTMGDHQWTRQAHVEDVSGSHGGSKDHSRARK